MAAETGHAIRKPAAKPSAPPKLVKVQLQPQSSHPASKPGSAPAKPSAAKPAGRSPSDSVKAAFTAGASRPANNPFPKAPAGKPGPSTTHASTGEEGHGFNYPKYANPAASPYLTGAQQAALNKLLFAYGQKDLTANQTLSDTQAKYGNDMTSAIAQSTANADRTAWSMSARGLGESSIRDAALNDISGHLAITENVLNANLARARTDWQNALSADDYNRGQTTAEYNDLAVANAQGQTVDPTLAPQRHLLPESSPPMPNSGGVAATAQKPSTARPPNSVAPSAVNPPAPFNPHSGTQTYNLVPSRTPGQMVYQLPTPGSAGPIQPHPATGLPTYKSGDAGI